MLQKRLHTSGAWGGVPFVTGVGFKRIADAVCDTNKRNGHGTCLLDARHVQNRSLVYVDTKDLHLLKGVMNRHAAASIGHARQPLHSFLRFRSWTGRGVGGYQEGGGGGTCWDP